MVTQYGDFAKLYDTLMSDVDYEAWSIYIAHLISEMNPNARDIAECACGTGMITVHLKKSGFNITGTDISEEMLMVAAENARNAGVMIPFACQDMQKLAFHKPKDAIISACDGVNYLTSVKAITNFFERAYESLKTGGVLLFDVSSRYKLENVLGCNTFAEDAGECAYIWKNMYDNESKLIEMNLTFFEKSGDAYRRFTEKHIQRAHSVQEITNALHRVGFQNINTYAAFTKQEICEDTERIQFVAIKS